MKMHINNDDHYNVHNCTIKYDYVLWIDLSWSVKFVIILQYEYKYRPVTSKRAIRCRMKLRNSSLKIACHCPQ